uniref:Uncharacterized protein n=1 Tax=Odontella aurita TaxID=265563 RepID=A0A7S4N0B6_9STRA
MSIFICTLQNARQAELLSKSNHFFFVLGCNSSRSTFILSQNLNWISISPWNTICDCIHGIGLCRICESKQHLSDQASKASPRPLENEASGPIHINSSSGLSLAEDRGLIARFFY